MNFIKVVLVLTSFKLFALDHSLWDQILKSRVDSYGFFDYKGFLKDKNFDRSLPGFKCLGVNWILKYLDKEISLNDAIVLSKRDTRRYVKRQLTWFRHNFNPDLILRI